MNWAAHGIFPIFLFASLISRASSSTFMFAPSRFQLHSFHLPRGVVSDSSFQPRLPRVSDHETMSKPLSLAELRVDDAKNPPSDVLSSADRPRYGRALNGVCE